MLSVCSRLEREAHDDLTCFDDLRFGSLGGRSALGIPPSTFYRYHKDQFEVMVAMADHRIGLRRGCEWRFRLRYLLGFLVAFLLVGCADSAQTVVSSPTAVAPAAPSATPGAAAATVPLGSDLELAKVAAVADIKGDEKTVQQVMQANPQAVALFVKTDRQSYNLDMYTVVGAAVEQKPSSPNQDGTVMYYLDVPVKTPQGTSQRFSIQVRVNPVAHRVTSIDPMGIGLD